MTTNLIDLETRLNELRDDAKQIEADITAPPAPSPFKTALFAATLTGIGGLLVGIAIGTTYIAPTL